MEKNIISGDIIDSWDNCLSHYLGPPLGYSSHDLVLISTTGLLWDLGPLFLKNGKWSLRYRHNHNGSFYEPTTVSASQSMHYWPFSLYAAWCGFYKHYTFTYYLLLTLKNNDFHYMYLLILGSTDIIFNPLLWILVVFLSVEVLSLRLFLNVLVVLVFVGIVCTTKQWKHKGCKPVHKWTAKIHDTTPTGKYVYLMWHNNKLQNSLWPQYW